MIAPNEDALAAGPGEPTTPMEPPIAFSAPAPAPAPALPWWNPGQMVDGSQVPPGMYARFGQTPAGLLEWARINHSHLGIPGQYNAAVLMQAAGAMTVLLSDLEEIKRHLPTLRRVLNGESLHNDDVRHAFQDAIDELAAHTVSVEVVTTPNEPTTTETTTITPN